MAGEKMVVVIEFDLPTEANPEKPQEILQSVKSVFENETGITIYMAIRETADDIRTLLTMDASE
jgi:hypothetical protein